MRVGVLGSGPDFPFFAHFPWLLTRNWRQLRRAVPTWRVALPIAPAPSEALISERARVRRVGCPALMKRRDPAVVGRSPATGRAPDLPQLTVLVPPTVVPGVGRLVASDGVSGCVTATSTIVAPRKLRSRPRHRSRSRTNTGPRRAGISPPPGRGRLGSWCTWVRHRPGSSGSSPSTRAARCARLGTRPLRVCWSNVDAAHERTNHRFAHALHGSVRESLPKPASSARKPVEEAVGTLDHSESRALIGIDRTLSVCIDFWRIDKK